MALTATTVREAGGFCGARPGSAASRLRPQRTTNIVIGTRRPVSRQRPEIKLERSTPADDDNVASLPPAVVSLPAGQRRPDGRAASLPPFTEGTPTASSIITPGYHAGIGGDGGGDSGLVGRRGRGRRWEGEGMMDDVGERSVRRPADRTYAPVWRHTQCQARRPERPCGELGTLGHLSAIAILWD